MPPASLAGLWNGVAYMSSGKIIYHFDGVIPISSPRRGDSIAEDVRENAGVSNIRDNGCLRYHHPGGSGNHPGPKRIGADGMVGPLTKIILYNEDPGLDIPHLLPVPTGDDRIEPGNAGKRQTAGHFISRGETISDLNEENRP